MAPSNPKKSNISKNSNSSPKKSQSAGGTNKEKEASLSKLSAAMALAPENKKFLFQRLIDRILEEK